MNPFLTPELTRQMLVKLNQDNTDIREHDVVDVYHQDGYHLIVRLQPTIHCELRDPIGQPIRLSIKLQKTIEEIILKKFE